MASPELPNDPPTSAHPQLRLAFDLALWRQQEQVARARALDGKLGQTIGLSAAMIAVFGSAVLLAGPNLSAISVAVTVAAALFIANVILSAWAFVIGRWTLAPNLRQLFDDAVSADEGEMLRWATEALLHAIDANEQILRFKEVLTTLAIVLTAATAVAIASAAIHAVL